MFLKSSTLGNESDHKMFHNLDSFTSLNPRDLDILPIIAYREFDTQIALFDSLRREDRKSSNYTHYKIKCKKEILTVILTIHC